MKPRHLLGLLAVVALIVVDLALRFRDPGKYAAQERLEEGAISDEALDIAINAFPGEGVTNTFDVWEWRLFYPWAPEDDIHHGHELLEEIVEQVTRIATRIGYREKDVQVSRRNPESRTDVYIDIGEEDIGMKYRGRQAREIETKGVFLELKLRKRIRYQKGFFSGRNYSMEAWDKLVSTSIDVDAGSKAIVDVLQQAVDEFDRFKVGNKAEQFRYNPVKDKLLRQAIAAAEAPGAVRKITLVKRRYLNKMWLSNKTEKDRFKFEVTSVRTEDEQKWWSIAVEGPSKLLTASFGDFALTIPSLKKVIDTGDVIYAGYPGFIKTL